MGARIAVAVGVLLCVAGLAGTIVGIVVLASPEEDSVLRETRTTLPSGARTVELRAQTYVVLYEEAEVLKRDGYMKPLPRLQVGVRASPTAAPLPLGSPPRTTFVTTTDRGEVRQVATIDVPRAGAWRLSAAGGRGGQPEAVLLGEPAGDEVTRNGLLASGAVVLFLAGIALVTRGRRRVRA